jgi:hypothetical protein
MFEEHEWISYLLILALNIKRDRIFIAKYTT